MLSATTQWYFLGNCSYIGKFFLGGTDSGSENNWKWTSGADWEFENWKSGEPNGGGRENCMEMEASGLGLWNDIDCSGFAGRCNEVGHTACNHRPSAEPKRWINSSWYSSFQTSLCLDMSVATAWSRKRFLLKRLRTVASGQSRTWIILLVGLYWWWSLGLCFDYL